MLCASFSTICHHLTLNRVSFFLPFGAVAFFLLASVLPKYSASELETESTRDSSFLVLLLALIRPLLWVEMRQAVQAGKEQIEHWKELGWKGHHQYSDAVERA